MWLTGCLFCLLAVWSESLLCIAGRRDSTWRRSNQDIDWMARGRDELEASLGVWPKWKPAKNVILFIGDGMGVSTLTAARFFRAQKVTSDSEEDGRLSWEDFPHTGLVKTYNTDQGTADSAGTATAFLCGEKTRNGVIGVNQNVPRGNCSATKGNELKSILHYAQDEGKWAGVVTTAKITDATPACSYAQSADRDWENDGKVPAGNACWDIAKQLVHRDDNKEIRVILGGGREHFLPNNVSDPEYSRITGDRTDGVDFTQEWQRIKLEEMGIPENKFKYVWEKAGFDAVRSSEVDYLLGLFESGGMKYEADRLEETEESPQEPSLADMTEKALHILQRSENGYFLLVEGGLIDVAHHGNNAYRALSDVVAMQDAVQKAMELTDEEDTLIVVTADHSHVFTISGYQKLDADILGLVVTNSDELAFADDNKPYLILSYANGPGFNIHRPSDNSPDDSARMDLTNVSTTGKDFRQDAGIPRGSETHGGEDVAVYARGPMSQLFVGQHEQHYIAHAMMYASCLGWNKEMCDSPRPPPTQDPGICDEGSSFQISNNIVLIMALLIGSTFFM